MLDVLLICDSKEMSDVKLLQLCAKLPINIIAKVAPGENALNAIRKYKPALVINSIEAATLMLKDFTIKHTEPRLSIMSSTHQGIQLVPISEIIYFQAEDKYVIAHHNKGELLIEDSLASLELEFAQQFVRIHRKTLVAIVKIANLYKTEKGHHFIKLIGVDHDLPVSRRQLANVRKVLLCK